MARYSWWWQSQMDGQTQDVMNNDPSDTMADMVGLISILRNNRVDNDIKATTKALWPRSIDLVRQIITFHAHKNEFEDLYGDPTSTISNQHLCLRLNRLATCFYVTRRASDMHPETRRCDTHTRGITMGLIQSTYVPGDAWTSQDFIYASTISAAFHHHH